LRDSTRKIRKITLRTRIFPADHQFELRVLDKAGEIRVLGDT